MLAHMGRRLAHNAGPFSSEQCVCCRIGRFVSQTGFYVVPCIICVCWLGVVRVCVNGCVSI